MSWSTGIVGHPILHQLGVFRAVRFIRAVSHAYRRECRWTDRGQA